ncbi:MAG: glycosyltransferase [Clostridia bacterium]|nr:glycosyltransferase [Clostridia bacterium]
MKVLVLSVATGGGHLTTSKAIANYINQIGHEAMVVDTYEYIAPILNTGLSKGYLMSTKYAPGVYGKVYTKCENKDATNKRIYAIKTMNTIIRRKFVKLIKDYKPDAIVCSHVMAAQLVDSVRPMCVGDDVLTVGIVTDFTLHPYWEDTSFDYYITASELLNLRLEKKGIFAEQIKPFGIPVDFKFSQKLDKKEARRMLGIDDKKTLLVMSGSMGYGNVIKNIRQLDSLDADFQLIVVCGNNKRLKKRVENLVTQKKKYVYGFTDKVDIMMSASECIVTKPGGLTVSEALAKELPIILMNPIPGQEDRNMEFLLNNGAAQAISSTYPLDEAVYELFSNEWRLENAVNTVKYFSKPNATKDLCEFIINELTEK